MNSALYGYFHTACNAFPEEKCIVDVQQNRFYSYRNIRERVENMSLLLQNANVKSGERIGILLPKSVHAVVTLLSLTKSGQLYIPLDNESPAGRIQSILKNCQVHRVVSLSERKNEMSKAGYTHITDISEGISLYSLEDLSASLSHPSHAYILNTSGSTGVPKPVLVSHKAAKSFVDWAANYLGITHGMVFSSIAPIHFDLSVFDLFVAFKTGGSVCLFTAVMMKNPLLIAESIQKYEIEVVYATPTTLKLLLAFGKLQRHNHTSLKKVIYAGEVFSVEPLQQLMMQWKPAAFYNFYGPTETNVCTAYSLPADISALTEIPIGEACSHMKVKLEKQTQGNELWVTGDALMEEYFNDATHTAEVFQTDENGIKWYSTGDLVRMDTHHQLHFLGRNDRMIKHHGYRIEPGEIENAALKHSSVKQATVMLVEAGEENKLVLCYSGTEENFLILKEHFTKHVPVYMVPDNFLYLDQWPVTSTGKTDVMKLREMYADSI
ncbi:MAG: AMP-binding protein [Flavobacteriales bacterium]